MNRFTKRLPQGFFALLAVAAMSFAPWQAHASLIGDTIEGTLHLNGFPQNYFDTTTPLGVAPVNAVVTDPGVEFTSFQPGTVFNISADFDSDELWLTFQNPLAGSFTSLPMNFWFEDLDWVPNPGIIVGLVNTGGLAPSSLNHTADDIHISFDPLLLTAGQTVMSHFEIITIHVPEPSTYLMLGTMAGFAILVAHRRKKVRA